MKPVRIFTHIACEPPGYLAQLLNKLEYPYQQVCLFDGEQVPMDLSDIAGLVFMGGPGNVSQPTEWMTQEIELIRKAVDNGTPVLGICLGGQLMSKALGGDVHPGNAVEVGWQEVSLLADAQNHPCFASAPPIFPVFQWHAHVFTLPPNCTPLATSHCTECQAFSHGNSLAVQFHLEMTEDIIRSLMTLYGGDLAGDSNCNQNSEQILDNIANRAARVNAMADLIFTPWFRSLYD